MNSLLTLIHQKNTKWTVRIILTILLLPMIQSINGQVPADCLFNCAETDCGDELNLSEVITKVVMHHGTPQNSVISQYETWVDNILDGSTTCCNVYIDNIFNLDATGSLFSHTYRGNQVNLPTSCGGEVRISIVFKGSCPIDSKEERAELQLKVWSLPEISRPFNYSGSLCSDGTEIKADFNAWIDEFELPDEITNPICSSYDEGYQYVCFLEWEDVAQPTASIDGIAPLQSITNCADLISGAYDLECVKQTLKDSYDGDCPIDLTLRLGYRTSVANCANSEVSSQFTVRGPNVRLSSAKPVSAGACANQAFRTAAFQDWISSFSHGSDCNLREIFTIDGDYNTYYTRSEMDTFKIDECQDSIVITYAVGCDLDVQYIERTMYFERATVAPEEITICPGEPVNLALDLQVPGTFNPGAVVAKYQLYEDGPLLEAEEVPIAIQLSSTSPLTVTYTQPIRPYVRCRDSEEFCYGDFTTMTIHVRPSLKSLEGEDVQINSGAPIGLQLNLEGIGITPSHYMVEFEGLESCSGFSNGTYSFSELQNLLDRQSTGSCAFNCGDLQAKMIVTPMNDECTGNPTTYNITILHEDVVPPSISCPPGFSIECESDLSSCEIGIGEVETSDDCSTPTVSCGDSQLEGGPCGGTIVRTFMATDASGNGSSCTQTITVDDNTAPLISCPADLTLSLSPACEVDTAVENTGIATATDNCSEPIVTYSNTITDTCGAGYTIVRTWTATDDCGNTSECDQIIKVLDMTAPEISCPIDLTLYKDDLCHIESNPLVTGRASAADNCTLEGSIVIVHSDEITDLCFGSYQISRLWTATDDCGNSSTCVQTITVLDTTSPTILCPPDTVLYFSDQCLIDDSPAVTGLPTADDNCTIVNDISIQYDDEKTSTCGSSYTLHRTWTSTDACGNTSSCIQIITVLDTIAPTVDCLLDWALGYNPEVPPASSSDLSAFDHCGPAEVIVTQGEILQEGCSFKRTDTYTAIDLCGNATTCKRDLFWTEDHIAPIISDIPSDLEINCLSEAPLSSPIITATDNCDGTVPVKYKEEYIPDACGGMQIQRTWSATDESGNTATEVQIITFLDNTPPTLIVPTDTTIELGNEVPTPKYQVYDECSEVTVDIKETRTEGDPGEYTLERTWTATDACGNAAKARQVVRVEDNIAPKITLVNSMLSHIPNGGFMEMYHCTDPAVAMSDVIVSDVNPVVNMTTFDKLLTSNACSSFGYYKKWKCGYIALDGAGNETEYSFYVLQYDTTAPSFTGVPPDLALSCEAGNSAPLADVTADDDCRGSLPVTLRETQLTNPGDTSQSALIRTWSASDACGNTTQSSQTITFCGFDMNLAASKLGQRVWLDENKNGMQDLWEVGVNNVQINLYWLDSSGIESPIMIDSVLTASQDNSMGHYEFSHLFPGKYQIEVKVPENMDITAFKMGNTDSLDSDIIPETFMSTIIQIDTQEVQHAIDIGLTYQESTSENVLKTFQGSSNGCINWLTWETNSETNVRSFNLEKSDNGTNFSLLETVYPAGGHLQGARYDVKDNQSPSNAKYRLRVSYFSGSQELSKSIVLENECGGVTIDDFSVFPNPTRNQSTIRFMINKTSPIRWKLFDILGRMIREETTFIRKGEYEQSLDLKNHPDGIYWIQVDTGSKIYLKKIVKNNS